MRTVKTPSAGTSSQHNSQHIIITVFLPNVFSFCISWKKKKKIKAILKKKKQQKIIVGTGTIVMQ